MSSHFQPTTKSLSAPIWNVGAGQSTQEAVKTGSSDFWESYIQETLRSVSEVTILSSREVIKAAQARLDVQIEFMKNATRIFSARRNAMVSFISRIPEDVLLRVFAYLVDDDPPNLVCSGQGHRRYLGWIQVTHVCRPWREASLADSSLWVRIERGITPDWALAMLSRSNRRPLKVDISFYHTHIQVIDKILGNPSLQRVSELDLQIDHIEEMYEDWLKQIQGSAPLLESLSIRVIDNYDKLYLPMSLSASSHPRLRSLSLYNCFGLPCGEDVLQNLVYLKIVGERGHRHNLLVEQLVPILQASPRLLTLILLCFETRNHNTQDESSDVVLGHHRTRLPYLCTLSLRADNDAIPSFLSRVEIPSSVVVSLKLGTYDTRSHPSWSLIPQLLPWNQVARQHQADNHFGLLDLGVYVTKELTISGTNGRPGRLKVEIEVTDFGLHHLAGLVESFYAQKYFAHVSSLSIEPETVIQPLTIEKLLGLSGMSSLTKLHVRMPPTPRWASDMRNTIYLLCALTLPVEDDDSLDVLKLPALRHFVLDEVPKKQGPDAFREPEDFEKPLLQFFAFRRSRGKPLLQFDARPSNEDTVELTSRVAKFLGDPDSTDVLSVPAGS